jgi:hypothetical protein
LRGQGCCSTDDADSESGTGLQEFPASIGHEGTHFLVPARLTSGGRTLKKTGNCSTGLKQVSVTWNAASARVVPASKQLCAPGSPDRQALEQHGR